MSPGESATMDPGAHESDEVPDPARKAEALQQEAASVPLRRRAPETNERVLVPASLTPEELDELLAFLHRTHPRVFRLRRPRGRRPNGPYSSDLQLVLVPEEEVRNQRRIHWLYERRDQLEAELEDIENRLAELRGD